MFGQDNAKLPIEPMLMIDRILDISNKGGAYNKGSILAEMDITEELWFFHCHFKGDPVMPGCLGLDGMWQLVGFFLTLEWGNWQRKSIRCWGCKIPWPSKAIP